MSGTRLAPPPYVMAKSTNGKKRSTVRPAPDHSSLRSVVLNRSANVTEYDIARRAYELYLARDCEDGHDVDDWLDAERELCEPLDRGV